MKNVVLGVTGGIAAYKACDMVSLLRERQCEVRAAMTRAATRFLQPLTLAALTGHKVLVDELEGEIDPSIPHVSWARWADAVVVAPATADFLGKLAHGLADDGLTCLVLALEAGKPVVLAPAMNTSMWQNPLVQQNVARLRGLAAGARFRVVEPVEKRLACGETGMGALAPAGEIADAVSALLALS
ncbi:MAG: hypothetical protein HY812_13885 [Planctomycetes bacterium]|nr:hypothetical protein [Planctomycetota bacterium]